MNINYVVLIDFLNKVKIDHTESIIYANKYCYVDEFDDFWNYTKYKVVTVCSNGIIRIYERKIECNVDSEYEIKCVI